MAIMTQVLALILALSLCGCLPRQAKFAPVGAHETLPTDQIEAEWPLEWMTLRPGEKDENANKEGIVLLLSQDGFGLQVMQLTTRSLETEFKYTKKKLSADLLPQEAAEIVLDNIRATPEIVDLHIVENAPAMLVGVPGFKLNYTFRGKSGLQRQVVLYGCVDRGMLVTLALNSVRRHYFQRGLPALEKVKTSLRWKS